MSEQTKVKFRYKGRDGDVNPDLAPHNKNVAVLENGKVYEVPEALGERLLISSGWSPSGQEAKDWAESKGVAASASEDQADDSSSAPSPEDHLAQAKQESDEALAAEAKRLSQEETPETGDDEKEEE